VAHCRWESAQGHPTNWPVRQARVCPVLKPPRPRSPTAATVFSARRPWFTPPCPTCAHVCRHPYPLLCRCCSPFEHLHSHSARSPLLVALPCMVLHSRASSARSSGAAGATPCSNAGGLPRVIKVVAPLRISEVVAVSASTSTQTGCSGRPPAKPTPPRASPVYHAAQRPVNRRQRRPYCTTGVVSPPPSHHRPPPRGQPAPATLRPHRRCHKLRPHPVHLVDPTSRRLRCSSDRPPSSFSDQALAATDSITPVSSWPFLPTIVFPPSLRCSLTRSPATRTVGSPEFGRRRHPASMEPPIPRFPFRAARPVPYWAGQFRPKRNSGTYPFSRKYFESIQINSNI
jgi:hypothetical protein